ncbi:vitellogenin receptor-like protein-related-related [Holotrichia oblita]|uniref:Vitellogenin receptor-like protein-related-related n=1 Tax=Holotrichia oblita TaxID=644536 RepID=A0ACB9TU93_HOLOL|nr:vitellogenin receptor-like protein-related-related [Holotrichia oblita]
MFYITRKRCKRHKIINLAVTINDQIKLLTRNGTVVGATLSFTRLKALTFDNVRHQFIASDMNQQNDTIYSISLKEEGNYNNPIVQDLPDDIQGLAIDPLTDILYWTDPKYKSIHSVSLNDPTKAEIFMQFDKEEPQDLAIDSCRRYLYFTNAFNDRPSIDRINLNTKQHEVIVDSGLHTPVGIAIDYVAKKLYWSDSGPGIYFRIESATLEGKEREIVIYDTHQRPFGLAVDSEFIYWTDINNNALWKRKKNHSGSKASGRSPLKHFEERPQGLIAKHLGFAGTPDCENVMNLTREYSESTTEFYEQFVEEVTEKMEIQCLNNGKLTGNACLCPTGYVGPFCEIPLCHNFCMHGKCGFTANGYPKCTCNAGYIGNRCEIYVCDNFCLNNGTCVHDSNEIWGAKCNCTAKFIGSRCEINIDNLCNKFCNNELEEPKNLNCNCSATSDGEIIDQNFTNPLRPQEVKISKHSLIEQLKDPTVLILSICMLVSLCLSTILLVYVCKMKKSKGRPRVNKRIIVNKNVTPLTYRPQSTTQECEITIENCCNMNVCETPCFEPPQLRRKSAKDEKKTLLTNMENPDELC